MQYAFSESTTLNVVTDYDEATDTIVEDCEEVFGADEVFEATLIPSSRRGYVDIQFGDGSVAFCVNIRAIRQVN